MEFSTQVRTFLIIAVTGVFLGVLFDTYRVMRRRFQPPWLITSVIDLIYCLLASGIAFAALLMSNWGELRFYVFIALFSGLFFYYRLASRHVMQLIITLFKLIARIGRTAKLVFAFSIIRPAVFVTQAALWPFRLMGKKYSAWHKKRRPPPPPPEGAPPL